MGRVLVMGGTNFVSRCLARYLIQRGYEVDILTRGLHQADYTGYKNHFKCDRKMKDEMHILLEGRIYDAIFDISAYTREDVELLLSAIHIRNIKKYIFCSSGAVYEPCFESVSENYKRGENPNWGKYGLGKKEAEDYLFLLSETQAFPVIMFRPAYIYGEGNNLYRETYFFDRIKEGRAIPIPHGNETKTQFIHVDDLVRVFESAISNGNIGRAYNVTCPELISWEKLVETCGNVMGENALIKHVDVRNANVEARSYFPFRDVYYALNIANLIKDGFHIPDISLEEGMQKAYKWYIQASPGLSDGRMTRIEEMIR